MAITHITSLAQLDGILKRSPEKLTVIDFHATWCGPCHTIAPLYEALSGQYTNVNFLKCDVDAARDVASRYNIRTMPTFLFMKGQIVVDQVINTNYATIEKALREHSSGPTPAAPRPPRSKAPSDNNVDPLVVSAAALFIWSMSPRLVFEKVTDVGRSRYCGTISVMNLVLVCVQLAVAVA